MDHTTPTVARLSLSHNDFRHHRHYWHGGTVAPTGMAGPSHSPGIGLTRNGTIFMPGRTIGGGNVPNPLGFVAGRTTVGGLCNATRTTASTATATNTPATAPIFRHRHVMPPLPPSPPTAHLTEVGVRVVARAGNPDVAALPRRYRDAVTVTIVDYDPTWPDLFARRREVLLRVTGGRIVHIEHFGSTSVPGLAAKPIIDIVVAVRNVDTDGAALMATLAPMGYEFFDAGMSGRMLLTRYEDGEDVEHLHIVPLERWDLMKERLMRDWLLAHPDARDRYATLKKDIAAAGLAGLDYTRAKTEFVQEIVDAARAARGLPSVDVWET